MTKHLAKIHVLVDFGILKAMGHGCDSIALVDAKLAAQVVELGYAEYVDPQPAPKVTKAAPDKPEQRPAPVDEVETR